MTDPAVALARLRQLRPELAAEPVTRLGEGTDHRVYAVGTAWLLRVPRHARADAALGTEAALLRWLAPHLPLPVPAYEVVGAGFAAYGRVPGTPALLAPTPPDVGALGPPLGAFLRALHRVDAAHAADLGVPQDDNPGLEEWVAAAEADLTLALRHGLVDGNTGSRLHAALARPRVPSPRPPTVIHGDFAAEHVLLDGHGRPCGVIDWSDAVIGDAAQDLGGLLHWGGPALLDAARPAYGDVDTATTARAHFYAVCRALGDVAYGVTEGRPAYVAAGQRALTWLEPGAAG